MDLVFLTGMMGSGKTEIGARLAARLGCSYYDTDEWIEEKEGKTIAEIFRKGGEEAFREMERTAIREIAREGGRGIVSTGGGTILASETRQVMRTVGRVAYLETSVDAAFARFAAEGPAAVRKRPLLAGKDPRGAWSALLAAREEAYAECDARIATDGLTPPEVVDRLVAALGLETPEGDDAK